MTEYYNKEFYKNIKLYLEREYVSNEYWNGQFEYVEDENDEVQEDNYRKMVLEHIEGMFPYWSMTQEFLNETNLTTTEYTEMIEFLVDEHQCEYIICIDMPKVLTLVLTYIFIENEEDFYKKYLSEVEAYQVTLGRFNNNKIIIDNNITDECTICYENTKLKTTKCNHNFCDECLDKINECALCRTHLLE